MSSTPRPRGQLVQALTCVVTAVALIAVSSCAAEEAPAPRAAPTTTEAPAPPTTTETPPEEPTPCTDPASEDLGDGFFERDGLVYETTADGCMYRPGTPEATAAPAATTSAPEPDLEPETVEVFEPSLTVVPVNVVEGRNTFTLQGSGFDPDLAIFTMMCDLADGLSEDEMVAAVDSLDASDCDLGSLEPATVNSGGSFAVTRDAVAVSDFVWVASDPGRIQAAGAAVFVGPAPEPEPTTTTTAQPEPEPEPTTEPGPAPNPEPEPTAEPEPQADPPPTTTTAPEPEECPDGQHAHDGEGCHLDETAESEPVAPPPDDWHCVEVGEGVVECSPTDDYICADTAEGRVCEPRDAETAARLAAEDEPEPEPAPEPEPEPEPAAGLLSRCTEGYGAGRVRILTGTTAGGTYSLVAEGEPDACERIKTWFTQALTAQRTSAAEGYFPCEYDGPDDIWVAGDLPADPAVLVGCWPTRLPDLQTRALIASELAYGGSDSEALSYAQGHASLPPNSPEMIEALWDCYHDALAGPPEDWQGHVDRWPTVNFCNGVLYSFGNPVRRMGVDPGCAAVQYSAGIEEFKERGTAVSETLTSNIGKRVAVYAGDYSWAGCDTHADRLLEWADPDMGDDASFAERCAVVIDAAADADQDAAAAAAAVYKLSLSAYVDVIKDMFCAGTVAGLESYPEFHGPYAASWLPPQGSVCWEKALLSAAVEAVYDRPVRGKLC